MESTNMEFTITNDTIVEKYGYNEECVKYKRLLVLRQELIDAKDFDNTACQQLHDVKRSKLHFKNMTEESNAVEESLRSEAEQKESIKEKLKQAKNTELIYPLKSKLTSLEECVSLQNCNATEIKSLNEKIAFLQKQTQSENSDKSFNFKVNKEQLLLEKYELEQENLLKQKEIEDKLSVIAKLQEDLKRLFLTINESKEILESVSSELETVKEERKELMDEIALIESQVSVSKSKPQVEGTRGNSLFGEIDDKREVFIKKIKQLKKVYAETMQSVARTASTLKKLRIEYIAITDESKKNEAVEPAPETYKINDIKTLEAIYSKLVEQYKYMPCQTDSNETEENQRNIDYKINKAEEEVRSIKNKVEEYSASCLQVGENVYYKKLHLIDLQSSLFLEQAKRANLRALLKDYKRSESRLEETEESIQESQSEKSYESKDTFQSSDIDRSLKTVNTCTNQENMKPEKDKKKAPLKFINIHKKINIDDL